MAPINYEIRERPRSWHIVSKGMYVNMIIIALYLIWEVLKTARNFHAGLNDKELKT